jgi:hypothetical protein
MDIDKKAERIRLCHRQTALEAQCQQCPERPKLDVTIRSPICTKCPTLIELQSIGDAFIELSKEKGVPYYPPWTKQEEGILLNLVKNEKKAIRKFLLQFPHRTVQGVKAKLSRMRNQL